MCCTTLRGLLISYFFVFYSFGVIMFGLISFLFTQAGLFPIDRLRMETTEQYMFRYFAVGLGCYSITYVLGCQAKVFHCRSRRPMLGAINLSCALFLVVGLAILLFYSGIKLWASLTFSLIGAAFASLFMMTASVYRNEYREEWDAWIAIQEGNVKATGFTSYIKEDEKAECVV